MLSTVTFGLGFPTLLGNPNLEEEDATTYTIGAQQGALDPVKFLVSWQRGDAMTADVLAADWEFFDVASRDLEELRWHYGIPPLLPADAAGGPEVIVSTAADRYAT